MKLLLAVMITLPLLGFAQSNGHQLIKKLEKYSEEVVTEFDQIPEERKESLRELGDYIYQKRSQKEPVKLTVICTHNSRRSHIGQLWLYAASAWYGIEDVDAFSGGTEATAFNPNAIDALKRTGFKIAPSSGYNEDMSPFYKAYLYRGSYSRKHLTMFSKKYDYATNPKENFAAIMVCSEADQSCPVVPGAETRLSLPFEDPRYYDGTASEELEYDKTVRLMARELFFAMNHAKEQLVQKMEQQK